MNKPTVDPKRTNLVAKAAHFSDQDGYQRYAEPGEMELMENGTLILACPGCGWVSGMRVGNPKPVKSPSWLMTGDIPLLTLSPSINCISCCGWHGYLKNGVFESC
jgi:hypothetical protein